MTERPRNLPRFVDGIDLHREYPVDEVMAMFYKGKLRGVAQAGWVVQAVGEETTMIRFIPWWESHIERREQGQLHQADFTLDAEKMRQDVEAEHPMRRRTPQQRTAAMMVRLMKTAAKTGTVPGLTPGQIRTIVGESWKEGDPISAEVVKAVAAYFLNQAQTANREADSHRTTRAHQFA